MALPKYTNINTLSISKKYPIYHTNNLTCRNSHNPIYPVYHVHFQYFVSYTGLSLIISMSMDYELLTVTKHL
jgi:hypothetical protein